MIRTVTVGPFPIQFGNVNQPMGLKAHRHTGAVTLVYATQARHGYPSFKETNDAIRVYLRELTERVFRDSTNEDVVERLWEALDGWVDPSWKPWGGEYRLQAVHLDVQGVLDDIGHDESTTRYTVERGLAVQPAGSDVIPGGAAAAHKVNIHIDQPPGPSAGAVALVRAAEASAAQRSRVGWGQ